MMKNNIIKLVLILFTLNVFAQSQKVAVVKNKDGMKLTVNGKPFMINGMNWDYVPIGENVLNGFWKRSDTYIKAALDAEMSLLKNMGVNTIRQYTGVPAKWITYIYDNYGIYTMLNHTFGAYGLTLDGVWYSNTEYANTKVQEYLMSEARTLANQYKNTRGLLLFMLGNENNYHLSWGGAETENIPIQKNGRVLKRARAMYKLFNDAALAMKQIDTAHPIAICNGDLLFLNLVKEECKDIDIYGTNMYRGISFTDAFERVKKELNKPILFAEFGADAFNARDNKEDQKSQAYYMLGNWEEIYQNAAGLGKAENSLGGFTFQFSDGWWKYGFNDRKNADVHDTNASWVGGGYQRDLAPGENNMNEEWFGICAKGATDARGLYTLYPRAAYYALKEAHAINPYEKGTTSNFIASYFNNIQITDAMLRARDDKAALTAESGGKVRISELRAEFTTFNTGGNKITTPIVDDINDFNTYPNKLGFDRMESFYVGIEAKPDESVRANVVFNILGNVAENPIDEIFYENRGRPKQVVQANGDLLTINDNERIKLYRANFDWNTKWFDVKGFYRTGHYHWGYEGDFFGLYLEANYGPNIDIYNGIGSSGFEVHGKKALKGLKVAYGPELWWGANPAILLKYSKEVKGIKLTGIYHEDVDNAGGAVSSIAIPLPKTRRVTMHAKKKIGKVGVEVGGIWGGQPLNGREFQVYNPVTNLAYKSTIQSKDNWGGKMKITYQSGALNWYAQGAAMGLVANGGADYTKTFTGWKLKDSGSGNQHNFLTGFTYSFGDFQVAPNFLWQKPIEGAIPATVLGAGRPRNVISDPFAVRGNRETTAGEILFTYDPTPGTWMYEWDNDRSEDAKFAMNLGFVYRHHPTTTDAAIGILPDGRTTFPFSAAPEAKDLWEVHSRIVSKVNPKLGLIANVYAGTAQPNGWEATQGAKINRTITRFGTDVRVIYKKVKFAGYVKVDDWGPYDYHRDFNQTFPLQLMADISTTAGKPDWFILPSTRIGARFTWRSLNRYSNRYNPTQRVNAAGIALPFPDAVGFENGNEWEIRTYIHINLGK